jgi:hypothetical protein
MASCPQVRSFDALQARCRGEFLDMPGLHLTLPQAARLFNLDVAQCQALFDELVAIGFLRRCNGTYMRTEAGRHAA